MANRDMKARVKLALQQADMRARLKRDRPRRVESRDLKRRVAATVLAFHRGWAPAEIARLFGWPVEDVARWLEAGKPLL